MLGDTPPSIYLPLFFCVFICLHHVFFVLLRFFNNFNYYHYGKIQQTTLHLSAQQLTLNFYGIAIVFIQQPTPQSGLASSSPAASNKPERSEAPQSSPASNYTPPFPREGDYNSVREYVEERKKYDPVFLQYCKTHNRTELCNRLTDEFGWTVKVDSYGKNVNRNL